MPVHVGAAPFRSASHSVADRFAASNQSDLDSRYLIRDNLELSTGHAGAVAHSHYVLVAAARSSVEKDF